MPGKIVKSTKIKVGKRDGKMKVLSRKTVNVNKALTPFAQRYITKMKYAETIFINASGPQAYRWRLNGLYDPNYSGTGHQPHGYDTLSTIYNRYRVIKASYNITGVDQSGQYIVICSLPANEQVNALSLSEMRENPRARFITQAPQAHLKTLKGSISIPSLVGRNKAQYMADDRYQAQVGSDPSEMALLNVYVQRLDEGTNTLNVPIQVTITYTVEWFDVKNLAQS